MNERERAKGRKIGGMEFSVYTGTEVSPSLSCGLPLGNLLTS